MAIEFLDIDEIVHSILDTGFKQANLSTATGVQMIPYNSHKFSVEERLQDIQKRIESATTADGVYIIRARYHNTDKVPAEFYLKKGNIDNIQLADKHQALPANVQAVPAQFIAPPVPQALPQDLSTEQILKMYQENATVKAENKWLKEEQARLISDIEDLEAELDGMADAGPSDQSQFWSSIAENLVPVLDQHYSFKRDELALQRQQLAAQLMGTPGTIPQGTPPPQAPPVQQPGNAQQDLRIEALTQLHPHDKAQLYNLKATNPQLFQTTLSKLEAHFANENNQGDEVGQ